MDAPCVLTPESYKMVAIVNFNSAKFVLCEGNYILLTDIMHINIIYSNIYFLSATTKMIMSTKLFGHASLSCLGDNRFVL